MLKKAADKSRDFLYLNPTMHLQSNKEVYIENCKRIEEYNDIYIRLKSRNIYIQIWGSNLKAFDFKTNGLIIKGKIDQIEFTEKR
ncbi:MAG TPA: YabP/YqfC family sporulation protein [Ruminococcus sp.]|nr:YabP/YqfC family sporulation protein [Ruminococcus sp.]